MQETQTAKYIQHMFPNAGMIGINAAVAGTGSDLGGRFKSCGALKKRGSGSKVVAH